MTAIDISYIASVSHNKWISATVISYIASVSQKDWLIDCFMAHQHRKAISAKKRC